MISCNMYFGRRLADWIFWARRDWITTIVSFETTVWLSRTARVMRALVSLTVPHTNYCNGFLVVLAHPRWHHIPLREERRWATNPSFIFLRTLAVTSTGRCQKHLTANPRFSAEDGSGQSCSQTLDIPRTAVLSSAQWSLRRSTPKRIRWAPALRKSTWTLCCNHVSIWALSAHQDHILSQERWVPGANRAVSTPLTGTALAKYSYLDDWSVFKYSILSHRLLREECQHFCAPISHFSLAARK